MHSRHQGRGGAHGAQQGQGTGAAGCNTAAHARGPPLRGAPAEPTPACYSLVVSATPCPAPARLRICLARSAPAAAEQKATEEVGLAVVLRPRRSRKAAAAAAGGVRRHAGAAVLQPLRGPQAVHQVHRLQARLGGGGAAGDAETPLRLVLLRHRAGCLRAAGAAQSGAGVVGRSMHLANRQILRCREVVPGCRPHSLPAAQCTPRPKSP